MNSKQKDCPRCKGVGARLYRHIPGEFTCGWANKYRIDDRPHWHGYCPRCLHEWIEEMKS